MSKCSLWDGVVLLRYTGCLDRHPQLHDGPRRNKTAERWAHLHTSHDHYYYYYFLCFYVSAGFQLTSGFTPSWRATVCCGSAAGRFTQHASVQSLRLSATTSVPPPQVSLACYSVAQGLSAAASYELTLVLLIKTKKAEAFTLLLWICEHLQLTHMWCNSKFKLVNFVCCNLFP